MIVKTQIRHTKTGIPSEVHATMEDWVTRGGFSGGMHSRRFDASVVMVQFMFPISTV